MRKWGFVLAAFATCSAELVEIGSDESISNAPFCGSWYPTLRDQVVVLGEEFGGPAAPIVGIQWKRAPGGDGECTFYDFTIYMGLTQLDELGMVFLDNYTPGTRTAVFSRSSWTAAAEVGQWVPVTLDTPFPYDPSTANLVIELEYSGSDAGSVYVWTWDTGAGRCALGEYGGTEAKGVFQSIPHLGLTVQYGLEQDTVAGIKTSLGGWGE